MGFKVIVDSLGTSHDYAEEDGDTYEVQGGVLRVATADRLVIYGPGGWMRLEVGQLPGPWARG